MNLLITFIYAAQQGVNKSKKIFGTFFKEIFKNLRKNLKNLKNVSKIPKILKNHLKNLEKNPKNPQNFWKKNSKIKNFQKNLTIFKSLFFRLCAPQEIFHLIKFLKNMTYLSSKFPMERIEAHSFLPGKLSLSWKNVKTCWFLVIFITRGGLEHD